MQRFVCVDCGKKIEWVIVKYFIISDVIKNQDWEWTKKLIYKMDVVKLRFWSPQFELEIVEWTQAVFCVKTNVFLSSVH